jgi:SAM-dependent methyltransferase
MTHSLHQVDLRAEQTLTILQELRKTSSSAEAGAVLALARLRQRAIEKFPQAQELFFTPEALEQATAWPVAEHRAAWLDRHAPPGPVLDLGCGIGGDMLALAQRRPVIAIERDSLRLRFAQANAAALGLTEAITFHQADWTTWLTEGALPAAAAAFADPARRVAERRIFSLHQMQPPLAALLRLAQTIPALGVKVMPGVLDEELPPNCGVEFISHAGVCKEAVLWLGPLAHHVRWASVHTADGWTCIVASGVAPPLGELKPGFVLHEPDPAVIRAGALLELCTRLAAHLFDPQIAYLVSPERRLDPLAQSFLIHEVAPFSLKQLNRRLEALGIGQVELKKRGFPDEPENLRPRLRLAPGRRPSVIFFTRRGGERLMLIAERLRHATVSSK